MLNENFRNGRIGHHLRASNPLISHMAFADDLMIFLMEKWPICRTLQILLKPSPPGQGAQWTVARPNYLSQDWISQKLLTSQLSASHLDHCLSSILASHWCIVSYKSVITDHWLINWSADSHHGLEERSHMREKQS